jgi:hypothetical protein
MIIFNRFGNVQPRRRQIIPNLIETYEVNGMYSEDRVKLPPSSVTSQYATTDYSSESVSSAWQYHQFNTNPNTTVNNPSKRSSSQSDASIAATMNAVSQPLAKMQNDLENKIANVLKELELLRKNDEKLSRKLEIKNKCQESNENLNVSMNDLMTKDSGCYVEDESRQKAIETDVRIKYLEKLQENQVPIF